jgi:glycosyltransferase involved in cell wall biosynthesis
MAHKDILIACETLGWSGGFIRFERFGRVARSRGHTVTFLPFRREAQDQRQLEFPIMTFEEAASRQWDATMIPGAGFGPDTIARFAQLTAGNFGRRVQHILNDQTRRAKFLAVNQSFRPHLVVFNNRHWPVGSFTEFRANQFHYIEGAVDTDRFFPTSPRSPAGGRFVIGGLANKNPAPLLEAARRLKDVELRLFGRPGNLPEQGADLVQAGRLVLPGLIEEQALPSFYRDLDCVMHTESFAGWANLAAEALASGVPLVCTPHGTLAFAVDGVSAIVMPEATPDAIVAAIERLRSDTALRQTLSSNGRDAILPFTWERYADELLNLIDSVDLDEQVLAFLG